MIVLMVLTVEGKKERGCRKDNSAWCRYRHEQTVPGSSVHLFFSSIYSSPPSPQYTHNPSHLRHSIWAFVTPYLHPQKCPGNIWEDALATNDRLKVSAHRLFPTMRHAHIHPHWATCAMDTSNKSTLMASRMLKISSKRWRADKAMTGLFLGTARGPLYPLLSCLITLYHSTATTPSASHSILYPLDHQEALFVYFLLIYPNADSPQCRYHERAYYSHILWNR